MATLGESVNIFRYRQKFGELGLMEAIDKITTGFGYPYPVRYIRLVAGPKHLNEAAGLAMRVLSLFGRYGLKVVLALPTLQPDCQTLIVEQKEAEAAFGRLIGNGLDVDRITSITVNEPWNAGLTTEQTTQLLAWYGELSGITNFILPVPPTNGPMLFRPYYEAAYLGDKPVDIHIYQRHNCPKAMADWYKQGFEMIDLLQAQGHTVFCFETNLYVYDPSAIGAAEGEERKVIWNASNKVALARAAETILRVQRKIRMFGIHKFFGSSENGWGLFTADGESPLCTLFVEGEDAFYRDLGIEEKE